MKKIKILVIFLLVFILSACSLITGNDKIVENSGLEKPKTDFDLAGRWKNTGIYELGKENQKIKEDQTEMFISSEVFDFNETYIIEPNVSSRFVNYYSYMRPKLAEIPEDLVIDTDTTIVYKFSDNVSYSQEFVKVGQDKLISIYLGKVYLFEKDSDITKADIKEKKAEVESAVKGEESVTNSDFGLAISFRVKNPISYNQINHNYYTYYIKKIKGDEKPSIVKVNDIVIPEASGLITVNNTDTKLSDGTISYSINAKPTFSNKMNANSLSTNYYKRIDYVDKDYIALTNFKYSGLSVAESYNILNLRDISKNAPLTATNIAGNAGNEIYITSYKENANLLAVKDKLDTIELEPNPSNIGMERIANGWKFISGIDQVVNKSNGSRVFRPFDLNLTPIINLGQSEKGNFTWREILSRRPGAKDATVSPDKKFILVQNNNSFEFYPVYYNYIGNKPMFTIQNINNYEIVMVQWVNNENIDKLYDEYMKLPRLNSYIIYP